MEEDDVQSGNSSDYSDESSEDTYHLQIHLQIQPIDLQIQVLPARELTLETLH